MVKMEKKKLGIYLLLILPPLFWAGNAVLARGVADLIPPVAMSFWRWALALLILLPFTWKQTCRDWPEIRQHWKIIFLLGLLGIASFNTLLYAAAHSTTAINIALTQSIMPVIIVVISFLLFRDRITPLQFFAIALCTVGAGHIVIRGDLQRLLQLEFVRGDLFMLLAVSLYGLYSVLLRKRPDIAPMSFLTTTFAVGVVLLLPLYLWEYQTAPPLHLNQPVVLSLLYVAFCPSILAYLFWNRGIHEIGANQAGLYINLIPLFASLLAVVFLGERFQGYHIVGIVLIAAGLLMFNLLSLRMKR
jgi:drug/metabolite transporter (DMT)-like permease